MSKYRVFSGPYLDTFHKVYHLWDTEDFVMIHTQYESSHSEVFLRKGVLKICSKFTGEHPCQSVISIKLHSSACVFSCKFAAYFQNTFFQEHLYVAVFDNNMSKQKDYRLKITAWLDKTLHVFTKLNPVSDYGKLSGDSFADHIIIPR